MSGQALSPLRERQRGLTRRLIVEAVSRVIQSSGAYQFSMQQVADEAGVSLRTLYRHFSTRDDLLEGISQELNTILQEVALPDEFEAVGIESLVGILGELYRALGQHPEMARAWVIARMATSVRTEGTRVRSDLLTRALEVMNPQLTQEEHRRLFAVIRLLTGSVAWKVMTDDLGLDTDDSVEATSWAVRTLLADIESGGRPGSRH